MGDELEPLRGARICIDDNGVIVGVGRGKSTDLVILPAFVNAHIHVLDYGFGGLNAIAESPSELLAWPGGLKARSILAATCKALDALDKLFSRLKRMGYAAIVVFLEGGGGLCRLVKSVAKAAGIASLVYGRANRIEHLEGCDGLGVPHLESSKWRRLAMEARSRGIRLAVHVSETQYQAMVHADNVFSLSIRPDHVVHLLWAPREVQQAFVEAGVMPVYAPVSNELLWGRAPEIAARVYNLGSDNAGWCSLNPWELMRRAYMIAKRSKRVEKGRAAAEVLAAMSVWAWRWHFGLPGLVEGSRVPLLVLHAPEVVRAVDPLVALVEIGDVDMVVGVRSSTHLEAYG